jgi:hypothetical protein
MQGALYFPLISPSASPWLTRALLYWDEVGTIVPSSWVYEPERLGEYTVDLVKRGLLRQMFPEQAEHLHTDHFANWLSDLENVELAARRARFKARRTIRIHRDKWLVMGSGLQTAESVGLAKRKRGADPWIDVETTTGNEFMATLALALCHPDCQAAGAEPRSTWVPATNRRAAFAALLAGLAPGGLDSAFEHDLRLRVRGETRAARVRTSILDKALPVPEVQPTPEQLERFRDQHGESLPGFRRDLESQIDKILMMKDEELELRAIERIADYVDQLVPQVRAYLREAGFRRVRRSPLVRMLKFVPFLSGPASALQDTAGSLETATHVEAEPLAYLALARVKLGPEVTYGVAPGRAPLVEAFAA